MAKQFDDIGKETKDLLERGFPNSGTFKISSETKTSDGVTVNASAVRCVKVKKDKPSEEVTATVEPKFDWSKNNIEIASKLSTNKNFEGEISFKDIGKNGSKISFKADDQEDKGFTTTSTVSYKDKNIAFKSSAAYPFTPSNPIQLIVNSVIHYNSILFGAGVVYDTHFQKDDKDVEPSFTASAAIGYVGRDYEANLSVKNFPTSKKDHPRDNLFTVAWYHKLSNSIKYGISFLLDQSQTKGPHAVVGGEWKADDSTTLKAKVGVKGIENTDQLEFRSAVSISQKITNHLTASVGADLNLRKIFGTNIGAGPSLGLELKFNA